ncbi:hypothetical protein BJ875DRAFT_247807, partial [Amylocarpus encephaloides]
LYTNISIVNSEQASKIRRRATSRHSDQRRCISSKFKAPTNVSNSKQTSRIRRRATSRHSDQRRCISSKFKAPTNVSNSKQTSRIRRRATSRHSDQRSMQKFKVQSSTKRIKLQTGTRSHHFPLPITIPRSALLSSPPILWNRNPHPSRTRTIDHRVTHRIRRGRLGNGRGFKTHQRTAQPTRAELPARGCDERRGRKRRRRRLRRVEIRERYMESRAHEYPLANPRRPIHLYHRSVIHPGTPQVIGRGGIKIVDDILRGHPPAEDTSIVVAGMIVLVRLIPWIEAEDSRALHFPSRVPEAHARSRWNRVGRLVFLVESAAEGLAELGEGRCVLGGIEDRAAELMTAELEPDLEDHAVLDELFGDHELDVVGGEGMSMFVYGGERLVADGRAVKSELGRRDDEVVMVRGTSDLVPDERTAIGGAFAGGMAAGDREAVFGGRGDDKEDVSFGATRMADKGLVLAGKGLSGVDGGDVIRHRGGVVA